MTDGRELLQRLRAGLPPFAVSIAVVVLISSYGLAHHDVIYALSLRPRSADGLTGILTMPLVHGSFAHLGVNLSLYLVFAPALLLRGLRYYVLTTLTLLASSGLLLWLVGRPGAHIGMSMLLFGYFGLLSARGAFERHFGSVLLSVLIVGAYAGLLWGIVPVDEGISWEGHLCGLLCGVAAAWALAGQGLAQRVSGR